MQVAEGEKFHAGKPIRFGTRASRVVVLGKSHNCERSYTVGIIGWIVLGLLAGAIAKLIMPGEDPGGFIVTTLIGIAGALVGGFIASALGIGDLDEFFDIGTWLIAVAGSLLLLFLYRMLSGDRMHHRSAYR